MGSIPDYNVMLDYISDTYGVTNGSTGAFEFRSEKSFKRFVAAIESCILRFENDEHKKMFFEAIGNKDFSIRSSLSKNVLLCCSGSLPTQINSSHEYRQKCL